MDIPEVKIVKTAAAGGSEIESWS